VNRARKISRRVWFAFVGSVVLFAAGLWLALRPRPAESAHTAEFTALVGEKEHLRGNDESVRDRLREQQQGLTRIAWTPEKLAALEQRNGPRWRWTWEPGEPRARVTVQRVAPRIEEWAVYRALVAELAKQPGVMVESVEILADGHARDRRLTRVAIGLRFVVAVAPDRDGQRAVPSHGPPTVAPAAVPATPRKVGAFTSHRRPSAFAEPPAPGTSGASFRSRPSGVQGRSYHPTKTKKDIL
jgi:hypothetical protein